jgi:hypothetical protein
MTISIDISPYVTEVTATPEVTTVNLSTQVTTVTASLALPSVLGLVVSGENISIAPYNNITATTLQGAIEQLADNNFSQSTVPVTNINEGDTWYNTSTDDFYVYRETSVGVFEWVPIILGAADGDSDTLDAGAF